MDAKDVVSHHLPQPVRAARYQAGEEIEGMLSAFGRVWSLAWEQGGIRRVVMVGDLTW
jgi:hypothetical protein